MERSVLSQVQRLPGVPSAHVGLDHMLGRDDKVRGEASVWGWGARLHEGCTRDAALPLEGKRLGWSHAPRARTHALPSPHTPPADWL